MNIENNKNTKPQNNLDLIEDTIGSLRHWQILILFTTSLTCIQAPWHQFGIIFLAPEVNFTCSDTNITDRCSSDCPSHEFDTSEFSQTIISEWDLVCSKEYLINKVLQPLIMAGVLAGSFIFGYLSDRFGRKYPLIIAGLVEAVAGVAAAYMPWFELFLVLKFVTGICVGGILLISFIIGMEIIGEPHRTVVGILLHVPYVVGHASLGLLGYLIRNWYTFQLVISVPNFLFLLLIWIIPESPRWLLLVDRTDECVQILKRAAKINKLATDNIREKVLINEIYLKEHSRKAGNFVDLVRTREMRLRTICISLVTFFMYVVYFGSSQYVGQIGNNIFLNVGTSGLLQLPASYVCIVLLEKYGRRNIIMLTGIFGGICCFLIAVVPENMDWPITVLGALAVTFGSKGFDVNYIYTGELYPTIIRSVGMGTAATIGRLGCMIAPVFLDFKMDFPWIPPVIYGICSLLITVFCFKLPETMNQKLAETVEEAEELGRRKTKLEMYQNNKVLYVDCS